MRAISDWVKRLPWLWLVPVAAAAIAVLFIALGSAFTSRSGDLWFELAKTGMLLLAVEVLGGAVAAAYRVFDDRREERRRLDDYRAGIAGELFDAYQRVKAVRRRLQAIDLLPPASGMLTDDQSTEVRRQMNLLIDAQLTIEKVASDLENQPPVFAPHGALIASKIEQAKDYVNDVIRDWQRNPEKFQSGADLSSLAPLAALQAFLSGAHDPGGLKESVSTPIAEAARLIHSLRLRVSPAQLGVPASENG